MTESCRVVGSSWLCSRRVVVRGPVRAGCSRVRGYTKPHGGREGAACNFRLCPFLPSFLLFFYPTTPTTPRSYGGFANYTATTDTIFDDYGALVFVYLCHIVLWPSCFTRKATMF
jgi:hypothetical protein